MRIYINSLLMLFITTASAQAGCPAFATGIKSKIAEFTAYQQRNTEVMNKDLATEKTCETKGAVLSAKIAGMAEAQSCEAQLDASGMDKELKELGQTCESTFQRIHAFQVDLHAKYLVVKKDLDDVMKYLKTTQVLDADCGSELSYGRKLAQDFVALETQIVSVEARALNGKVNYGKFKDTAAALELNTAARGKGCMGIAEALAGASGVAKGAKGQGAGVPVPIGKSRTPASDITGTEKKTPSLPK